MLYTSPISPEDHFKDYYQSDNLASGATYYNLSLNESFQNLYNGKIAFIKNIANIFSQGNFLDLGCGRGEFLKALAKTQFSDWSLEGLEPSVYAYRECVSAGLNVINRHFQDIPPPHNHYNVISLLSVLEHLVTPKAALLWCKEALTKDGILVIEVPNTLVPELSVSSFFTFEHIIHFTPWTLHTMLKNTGFNYIYRDQSPDGALRVIASESAIPHYSLSPAPTDDFFIAQNTVINYAKLETELLTKLETRVSTLLKEWKRRKLKIAIFGAGVHSLYLNSILPLSEYADCFIDNSIHKQGNEFLGLPVYAPDHINDSDINAVLISSGRFVNEIKIQLASISKKSISVGTCYE